MGNVVEVLTVSCWYVGSSGGRSIDSNQQPGLHFVRHRAAETGKSNLWGWATVKLRSKLASK